MDCVVMMVMEEVENVGDGEVHFGFQAISPPITSLIASRKALAAAQFDAEPKLWDGQVDNALRTAREGQLCSFAKDTMSFQTI